MNKRRTLRSHLAVEELEPRVLLDGVGLGHAGIDSPIEDLPLEYHVEGTNWIDPNLPRGHNRHIDHVSWDTDPSLDSLITVDVLVHDHGNLDAERLARINDAITEVNSAAANFGVNLNLMTVTDEAQFHNIHVHEDITSGCGSGALGCAEYAVYINQSGKFGDGHGNHLYAGEEVGDIGGKAEATVLSGFNWYTGADPSLIGPNQYDYQTVMTQELLHLVGEGHDSTVYDTDPEVADNTDHRSVMHGTLGQGIVRRSMSTHDQADLLTHLYNPGQAAEEEGGGGNDKEKGGPPPGKGKNKVAPLPAVDVLLPTPLALSGSEFATTGLNPPESPPDARPASEARAVEPESAALHDAALSAVTHEIERVQSTGGAAVAGDSDRSEDEGRPGDGTWINLRSAEKSRLGRVGLGVPPCFGRYCIFTSRRSTR